MPPGGVTGLGDPDFSFGAVLQKNSAHARDLRVPAIPPEFKGSGVTVNPDRIDVLHYTAFAHQAYPLRVHRPTCTQHRFLAALACPMRRAADHLAENQPVRVECRIPLQRVPRFIPELDP